MKNIILTLAAILISTPLAVMAQISECTTSKTDGQKVSYAKMDIVDTAVEAGSFKTLATALEAADLISTLKGSGPFTVFAPTDAAFAKIDAATLTELTTNDTETLGGILTYHVASGITPLAEALKSGAVVTAQGDSIQVAFNDGRVRVNGAEVIDADIRCTNGIVHVIDSVLLPAAPRQPEGILAKAKAAGAAENRVQHAA